MKSRLLVIAVVIAALAGFYLVTIRPMFESAPPPINRRINKEFRPESLPMPVLPAPKVEIPTIPLPAPEIVVPHTHPVAAKQMPRPLEVPIQNGATLDFSLGSNPILRTQGDDKAALDKAAKEIAEAVKHIEFPPIPPVQPAPQPEKK
ncbi:MAG TPA: hypothetical protein VGE76_19500 [Opitutaceae bacterium]